MNREEARSRFGDPNSLLKRGFRERRKTGRRQTVKAAGYGRCRLDCPWISELVHVSCFTCAKLDTSQVAPSKILGVSDENADAASSTALTIRLVS